MSYFKSEGEMAVKKIIILLVVFMFAIPVMSVQAVASKGKILLVASSTSTLELKDHRSMATGFYLNELAVPALRLIEEGYEVVVATPNGNKPVMDAHSSNAKLFGNDQAALQRALHFVDTYPSIQHPITLKEAVDSGLDQYSGIYVPGGHAPMNDLIQDASLGEVLRYFHQQAKPTAFLCHGPIAALAALTDASAYRKALVNGDFDAQKSTSVNWQYAGYHMTVFSNVEEYPGEKKLQGQVPFYVADALQIAGGIVEHGPIMKSYVVRDRELITGQNPASDHALAEELIKALNEKQAGK
ncbi:MAG: thiamine biosynthesis protein ThiJ [Firmicutes bacterium]|nr:thiamine biosynthesis protein ThiJ [Bacillota bacterium]